MRCPIFPDLTAKKLGEPINTWELYEYFIFMANASPYQNRLTENKL